MSILAELNAMLTDFGIPVATGIFSEEAPAEYMVITPLTDVFDLHADDTPGMDVQEVRISLFTKGSYTAIKNRLVRLLVSNGFTVTDRRYVGVDTETGYHNYAVDTAKSYEYETEEE